MNAEDLCKKVQDTKKADGNECNKEEMSSSEYAHRYMGRHGYSVRKHLQLITDEQKKYKRNY